MALINFRTGILPALTAVTPFTGGQSVQSRKASGFRRYFFKENRIYNIVILCLLICQFVLFKICYPFPDFFSDSFSYIRAANQGLDVNIWPIGYSKFLWLFHSITHSDIALVNFQFFFLEIACLYFYHTVIYNYPTGKNTRRILCFFLFFNPLNLYLANYVSSDALFLGLSLIWISLLIWIMCRPRVSQILLQAVVVAVAFTFRYNAMYYPLIAAAAFILSRQSTWRKLAGIVAGPILIVCFIVFSANAAKEMTGTAQFPPILGGWQWANNALYMRGFVKEDSTQFPTAETAELDRIARRYFSQPSRPQGQLADYVANFFIRERKAPLKTYLSEKYSKTPDYGSVAQWGMVAPVFGQYGRFLIRRHPLAYARYYLLVNANNYFLPPLEKLEKYNLGLDLITFDAANWFDFPSGEVDSISKDLQGQILFIYTPAFMTLNLLCILFAGIFLFTKSWRRLLISYNYLLIVLGGFILLNFVFSVSANIIVLRYETFPMIVLVAVVAMLAEQLDFGSKKATEARIAKASIPEIITT